MKKREGEIQAAILGYLELRGDVYLWRNNTGQYEARPGQWVRYGTLGSSDILGVWAPSGRMLCVEVKQPGEMPTKDQVRFAENVTKHGGIYLVARCVEDVRNALGQPMVRIQWSKPNRVYPR